MTVLQYADYLSVLFFFKQKTAYELRISDWSSDVCSSDLQGEDHGGEADPERDAGAVDHGREDVAALRVGAEQEARIALAVPDRRNLGIHQVDGGEGEGIVGRQPGRKDGRADETDGDEGRSGERRGGKECVREGRSRVTP